MWGFEDSTLSESIADSYLIQSFSGTPTVDEIATQKEVEDFMDSVTQQLPVSSNQLQLHQNAQQDDPICNQVIT